MLTDRLPGVTHILVAVLEIGESPILLLGIVACNVSIPSTELVQLNVVCPDAFVVA